MHNEPEEEKWIQYTAVRNSDNKPRPLVTRVMMLRSNIVTKLEFFYLRVECIASFLQPVAFAEGANIPGFVTQVCERLMFDFLYGNTSQISPVSNPTVNTAITVSPSTMLLPTLSIHFCFLCSKISNILLSGISVPIERSKEGLCSVLLWK